jgi:antitoxin VapB
MSSCRANRRDWDDFFSALKGADVPIDFLNEKERNQGLQDRDPFEGWRE